MGREDAYPEEAPAKQVKVSDFWIDKTEVTNAQFASFVKATGYVTQAEKGLDAERFPDIAQEFRSPGSMVFTPPDSLQGASPFVWWRFVPGADWRHPFGPDSTIAGKEDYPVVQVTHDDAAAYAAWAGRRLPSEAEWEFAAASGKEDEGAKSTAPPAEANTWQGVFPVLNTAGDGFEGLAPAGCFAADKKGVFDLVGNVWELTSSAYYPRHDAAETGEGFDPRTPGVPVYVIKGGSYLCAENYCVRYRPEARQPMDAFLGSSHIGFRTVRNN